MLSKLAKAMLTSTSIAPVLGAYGIVELVYGSDPKRALCWFLAGVGLVVVAWLMLQYARTHLPHTEISVERSSVKDSEVLTYLVTYLLPLIAKDSLDIDKNYLAAIYVFALIFVCIYYGNAFHFNPVLGLLGYHFYEVECADGMKHLYITANTIKTQKMERKVLQLSDYIFLEPKE
ncbi:MAG: hypothetical protein P4L84_06570 [Isosphaeraceae bacterium]|nr:hypothetical protein [Isosphaeraceae bacterium]